MSIPASPLTFMLETRFKVVPCVRNYLSGWRAQAEKIPDLELRKQAIASIETKRFHCEGGAIYGLLAKSNWREAIRFIVAYQTISDYLDNLCDRSTSLDPEDFRALHESIVHALSPGTELSDYYRFRKEREDGGYLHSLVSTCQQILVQIPNYPKIASTLHELASYYCDLQVYKHIKVEERVPRLKTWFALHQKQMPDLSWYEFSACAGSTLGIFCLVAYSFNQNFSEVLTHQVKHSYFPWVQGLHILLDYLIDREEDRLNGDLNFCFYYYSQDEMVERFKHFIKNATKSVAHLPHTKFHQLINQALLGVYLSDRKVREQQDVQSIAKQLLQLGGSSATFFFQNRLLASYLN